MRHALAVVLMLGFAACVGCHKKAPPEVGSAPATMPASPQKEVPITKLPPLSVKEKRDTVNAGGGNSAAMAVRRGIDRQRAQNYLAQIGLFYHTYYAEFGRTPTTMDEFVNYIKRDAQQEVKALQDGLLTLNLKAGLSSEVVLGYETEPYTDGSRLVMMGDKSVKIMSAQEFQSVKGNQ
jgi:hypothetical protein